MRGKARLVALALLSFVVAAVDVHGASLVLTSSDPPLVVNDFPLVGVHANIVAPPTPGTLSDIEITTTLSLTLASELSMVLTPPAATGVGPITLIAPGAALPPGNHVQVWNPTTTPALGALLSQPIDGTWSLMVTDVTDDAPGSASVGSLDLFQIEFQTPDAVPAADARGIALMALALLIALTLAVRSFRARPGRSLP